MDMQSIRLLVLCVDCIKFPYLLLRHQIALLSSEIAQCLHDLRVASIDINITAPYPSKLLLFGRLAMPIKPSKPDDMYASIRSYKGFSKSHESIE